MLAGKEWKEEERRQALEHGTNQYMMEHVLFLREDFASMVGKGKYLVLPYSVAKELMRLRLIPLGVKEERDQQPRWIGDYSYYNLNFKTLPIADLSNKKYCRALY